MFSFLFTSLTVTSLKNSEGALLKFRASEAGEPSHLTQTLTAEGPTEGVVLTRSTRA